ncbi:flagellar basal-body MS-ring/collar protein FliF [Rhodovulum visakhapatnamense]|uniref:flagellar basal-body MS-ring/collar protein FliF n=1 Tax=Rhodovulum visakhapatnamense TaxID=364297 RepID=UPI003132E97A
MRQKRGRSPPRNGRTQLQQLLSVWTGLSPRRRLVVVIATVAMFAAVLALSRVATSPRMALLYSGLDTSAAGDVIRALDQTGVAYEVRGPAIYVDSSQRDSLRMTLASDGLPANGSAGYELLDGLSGFGTTSQMFDAAYWRAKEGELARTIAGNSQFRTARVHIATPSARPFARDVRPSAAITVTPAGGSISAAQAKAIRYLVASSVSGMRPEDVSVIDGTTGTVVADESSIAAAGDDRAEILKGRLERLLSARLGPGRSIVEVSVDTETQRESIRERIIDPEGRVAISQNTQERQSTSSDTNGGSVTVASNLPNGDGSTDRSSQHKETETQEVVNYEVSETEREILRAPGAIRRLSIAVLVEGVTSTAADGTETWQPLPDADLESLRELIASAAGFDEQRGDALTIKSMPFQPLAEDGTGPQSSLFGEFTLDPLTLIQLAVLSVVALILGLFVVRPILASNGRAGVAGLPAPVGGADQTWLNGEIDPADGPQDDLGGLPGDLGLPAMTMASIDPSDFSDEPLGMDGFGGGGGSPVDRLRDLIESRRDESIAILRGWMEERQEKA